MTEFIQAIKTKFDADSALAALGALEFGLVADRRALPYCELHVLPGRGPLLPFGSKSLERWQVQFSIFGSTGLLALSGYGDAVAHSFDDTALTVSGQQVSSFTRIAGPILMDLTELNPQTALTGTGGRVYQCVLRYESIVFKSL